MVWPDEATQTADVRVETFKGFDKVLLVTVTSADQLAQWSAGSTAVARAIPGLGDVAYAGPQSATGDATTVAFRSGSRAVRIISPLSPSDGRHVSEAKLLELAQLIDSRMGQ